MHQDHGERRHPRCIQTAVRKPVQNLPEREQYAMSMDHEHDVNSKEIAAVPGVTDSRAFRLHSQGIARPRTRLQEW